LLRHLPHLQSLVGGICVSIIESTGYITRYTKKLQVRFGVDS